MRLGQVAGERTNDGTGRHDRQGGAPAREMTISEQAKRAGVDSAEQGRIRLACGDGFKGPLTGTKRTACHGPNSE